MKNDKIFTKVGANSMMMQLQSISNLQKTPGFEILPSEIRQLIFYNLTLENLFKNAAFVSKSWYESSRKIHSVRQVIDHLDSPTDVKIAISALKHLFPNCLKVLDNLIHKFQVKPSLQLFLLIGFFHHRNPSKVLEFTMPQQFSLDSPSLYQWVLTLDDDAVARILDFAKLFKNQSNIYQHVSVILSGNKLIGQLKKMNLLNAEELEQFSLSYIYFYYQEMGVSKEFDADKAFKFLNEIRIKHMGLKGLKDKIQQAFIFTKAKHIEKKAHLQGLDNFRAEEFLRYHLKLAYLMKMVNSGSQEENFLDFTIYKIDQNLVSKEEFLASFEKLSNFAAKLKLAEASFAAKLMKDIFDPSARNILEQTPPEEYYLHMFNKDSLNVFICCLTHPEASKLFSSYDDFQKIKSYFLAQLFCGLNKDKTTNFLITSEGFISKNDHFIQFKTSELYYFFFGRSLIAKDILFRDFSKLTAL